MNKECLLEFASALKRIDSGMCTGGGGGGLGWSSLGPPSSDNLPQKYKYKGLPCIRTSALLKLLEPYKYKGLEALEITNTHIIMVLGVFFLGGDSQEYTYYNPFGGLGGWEGVGGLEMRGGERGSTTSLPPSFFSLSSS